MPTLEFHIDATRPATRKIWVVATYSDLDQATVEFFMPTWTPGSYLLREYSRHVSRVEAVGDNQQPLSCRKASKNRFVVTTDGSKTIELKYRVYAHELSVRTAHVDSSHAYWNHACVLLWPVNKRQLPANITIDYPANWGVTCSLASEASTTKATDAAAVTLRASDLDHALDAPVLIGTAQQLNWDVHGIPHAIVLDGLAGITPPETLVSDLERIVKQAATVFGDSLPYESYVFMALFAAEGYGGLEHRDSTTLLMPRTSLTTESGYQDFLALAAHELFHAWNVKRMRPVEFWEYDYEQENYTKLLWLMEGWTAYYDDLLLVRAGLTTQSDYLASMAKNVRNMLAAPGRFELSLEESSFDAWIRLYRPDENTRNSSQNYYGNGAVAAMCLDLMIRRTTKGDRSLDNVLQALYQTTFTQGRGYEIADVHRVITEIAGNEVVDKLIELVTGPLDPALDDLLNDVGINIQSREAIRPFLGVGFRAGTTVLASVSDGSPADTCGLAPDDELLAIANLRVKAGNWQTTFHAVAQVGEPIALLVARKGVLQSLQATPTTGPGKVKLTVNGTASESQRAAGTAWMGQGRNN